MGRIYQNECNSWVGFLQHFIHRIDEFLLSYQTIQSIQLYLITHQWFKFKLSQVNNQIIALTGDINIKIMALKTTEYKQISQFLSSFTIQQHSQGSTVISSGNNTYLIRDIEISPQNQGQNSQQLTQIINTLYQHQTLSSKNILSLIDFDIIFNHTKTQTQIRAVYQYGKKSLSKQIQQRKLTEQHFDQQALWGLMYSITSPLAYLQEKNIIYGVLDPSRVFLDNNNIAIIDPSSTGIDPYEILPNRLYSPELLQQLRSIEDIDMFKSDVYVLGLMMLQCALLKMDLYQYDQDIITICLSEIKDIYSENLSQLIESLLNPDPQNRPSFAQVLNSISDLFEISTSQLTTLQPSAPDAQNQPNPICQIDQYSQRQNIDILETEYIRYDDHHFMAQVINHQNNRFSSNINRSPSELTESMIQEASEYSQTSSLCLEDSVQKSFEKSRRIYKAKQIKDKLITQDYALNSERDRSRSSVEQFNTQRAPTISDRNHNTSERAHNTSDRAHNTSQRSQRNTQKQHSRSQIMPNQDNFYAHSRSKTSNNLKQPLSQQQTYSQRFVKPSKLQQTRQKQDSKQNQFSKNNMVCFSPLNKDNLFTKPEIMKMIKSDIKKIQEKKKTGLSVHFNYFSQEDNKQENSKNQAQVVYGHVNRK